MEPGKLMNGLPADLYMQLNHIPNPPTKPCKDCQLAETPVIDQSREPPVIGGDVENKNGPAG
jgi:hypothetical protein